MKIEIEKPVVPRFVADWIEQLYGQGFNSDDLLEAMFSRNYEVAELKILKWFTDDKKRAVTAILYGYEVEQEPLYYAKIKGWGYLAPSQCFWSYIPEYGEYIVGSKVHSSFHLTELTMEEWNELGINGTNADFEEVSE